MTKKKQFFRFFCKCMKVKTEILYLHKYSDPLLSTLLNNLWQWLQPQVFFGMMLQAWHPCIWWSFSHSPLQILSSTVRLDGERCCTAIFRSLRRCLIRFMSRLWLGHSMTLRLLLKPLLRCPGYVLRVVVLLEGEPSPKSEVLSVLNFRQGSLCTSLRSSFFRSWLVSQSLPLKNIATAGCCHHPASP